MFLNEDQNDWANHMLIAEFVYNKDKNISIGHTYFEINCDYHPHNFFVDEVDSCLRSRTANKLVKKPRKLISIYQ